MSQVTEDPEVKAKRLGLVIRRPEVNELFLDLDSEKALEEFHQLLALYSTLYVEWPEVEIRNSKTPNHYHVTVKLDHDLVPRQRVLMQLALGSDRKRELLAIFQVDEGMGDDASVFFEQPMKLLPASVISHEPKDTFGLLDESL